MTGTCVGALGGPHYYDEKMQADAQIRRATSHAAFPPRFRLLDEVASPGEEVIGRSRRIALPRSSLPEAEPRPASNLLPEKAIHPQSCHLRHNAGSSKALKARFKGENGSRFRGIELNKVRRTNLTGGAIADANGNRTWVWNGDGDVDTARVRELGEGLSLNVPGETSAPTHNPYDRDRATQAPEAPVPDQNAKRRSLDDMRRLSEKIKKTKVWKRDK
jgi:hypothetical protein